MPLSVHTVLGFNTEGCFVEQATDGGGVAFYASAWVSSEGGGFVSPQRIHAEDDTNSGNIMKAKRGRKRGWM